MNIKSIIPNKDNNWVVEHDILYYKKFALIPLANIIDDELYINLDKRCIKPCVKLLEHCVNNKIDFLFCDSFTITEKHIWNEHLDGIFFSSLMMLEHPKFFKLVTSNKLNYIQILCKFIKLYNCHNRFIKMYDECKTNHFNYIIFDYYSSKRYFRVEDQSIRDYFDQLFREVKISLLLSED